MTGVQTCALPIRAEAERAKEPPTVYTDIKLIYTVTGKVSTKAMEDAVRLSKEKYCSVSQMLQKTAHITSVIEYQCVRTRERCDNP